MIRNTLFHVAILLVVVIDGEHCHAQPPKLADDRLQITLFAENPDIVTPIGMAIDPQDRVFVIESHTHLPPADYEGPRSDRIKTFIDDDQDGKADRVSVFADGIHQAMNLAVSPHGDLYVVCAREVLRLVDDNNDGACDRKEQVLELLTRERYAHNSLLGITFDRDGWMYVTRGNVGSHYYQFQGSDLSTVEGYGDGGSVVRCRPDGTRLEEFATGFWNPFDLHFDRNGRLLLIDNDPDARGPNRLLHVVRDGDYGYKSLYGGGGNHPFQGWDGSLPGTLPMIAGTGEAPSGLIDCSRSSLPRDYSRSVLVTVWNENSIEKFDIEPQGGSVTSRARQPFLTGPKYFRPVAMDGDSHGNLFVTDWMLVDYPNHGRGRIWRISPKPGVARTTPQPYYAPPRESDDVRKLRAVADCGVTELTQLLDSDSPFLRHAAWMRLAANEFHSHREALSRHQSAAVRLGALLASKQANRHSTALIRTYLSDPDADVRRAALMWAGESLQVDLLSDLDVALNRGNVNPILFETYLAAVENLSGGFAEALHQRKAHRANQLRRQLPSRLIAGVAKNLDLSDEVRAVAISKLSDDEVAANQVCDKR